MCPRGLTTTFLIDRCLGTTDVPNALRMAIAERGLEASVEVLDDHFDQACADEVWIAAAGARGWVVLTKDKHIKRRRAELDVLRGARVAAFILTSGDRTGAENASAFVAALPKIVSLTEKHTRPLIATVSGAGRVTVAEGQRRGSVRR